MANFDYGLGCACGLERYCRCGQDLSSVIEGVTMAKYDLREEKMKIEYDPTLKPKRLGDELEPRTKDNIVASYENIRKVPRYEPPVLNTEYVNDRPVEKMIYTEPQDFEIDAPGYNPKSDGKILSDGASTKYYELPSDAKEIQDLIEHKNMSFSVGNIFKACYRLGEKEGYDKAYDLRKIIWYAERELKRLANTT